MILSLGQVLTVVHPPEIARAAGITAGLTTIRGFERRYGEGWPHIGGHPRGARTWYDLTTKSLIDADGFNFSSRGEIVDRSSVH